MSQGDGMRVIVVGAGIVGASIAYHLARKGARVTVVEAGEIASGVTGRSFAWVNTCAAGPEAIAPLRKAAIDDYRRLERELPGLAVRWTGSLCYAQLSLAEPDAASTVVVSRQRIRDLEPNLRHPPEQAMHAPQEGALDAVAVAHALIAGAKAHGATVLTQTQVLGMRFDRDTLSGVNTSQGPWQPIGWCWLPATAARRWQVRWGTTCHRAFSRDLHPLPRPARAGARYHFERGHGSQARDRGLAVGGRGLSGRWPGAAARGGGTAHGRGHLRRTRRLERP